jgi:hypothetical protein
MYRWASVILLLAAVGYFIAVYPSAAVQHQHHDSFRPSMDLTQVLSVIRSLTTLMLILDARVLAPIRSRRKAGSEGATTYTIPKQVLFLSHCLLILCVIDTFPPIIKWEATESDLYACVKIIFGLLGVAFHVGSVLGNPEVTGAACQAQLVSWSCIGLVNITALPPSETSVSPSNNGVAACSPNGI